MFLVQVDSLLLFTHTHIENHQSFNFCASHLICVSVWLSDQQEEVNQYVQLTAACLTTGHTHTCSCKVSCFDADFDTGEDQAICVLQISLSLFIPPYPILHFIQEQKLFAHPISFDFSLYEFCIMLQL